MVSAMLVQTITKARDAANAVEQTKKSIQDVAQIRSFSGTAIRRPQGGHGDPVFGAVQLREKLMKKLKQQQNYAVFCYDQMLSALESIPDPVTRKLFYDRHYMNYSWELVAENAGIGVSAAKMRHKRYLDDERKKAAA